MDWKTELDISIIQGAAYRRHFLINYFRANPTKLCTRTFCLIQKPKKIKNKSDSKPHYTLVVQELRIRCKAKHQSLVTTLAWIPGMRGQERCSSRLFATWESRNEGSAIAGCSFGWQRSAKVQLILQNILNTACQPILNKCGPNTFDLRAKYVTIFGLNPTRRCIKQHIHKI